MEKYTADTLFDPPLTLFQPKTGYRFSLDPLILASHIHPGFENKIMEIGCGCGIISLILGTRHPDLRITGVEIQKTLAHLAKKNTEYNHLSGRIKILHQDIRTVAGSDIKAPVDIIVSNPPYRKRAAGRQNPDMGRALARHEITLDIFTLVRRADLFLTPRGRLCLIFPAARTDELTTALNTFGFQTGWIRFVHFLPMDEPGRILVSACRTGDKQITCRPPLYLYHRDGTPTEEHAALFQW
ncbi:MAG: methyltransferase [Desulfotignum sp.]|nr:methyltransferase [Desulfotignum sp.]